MKPLSKTVAPSSSSDIPTASRKDVGEPESGSTSDEGSQDEGYDQPEDYREYGDWKEDYADAVGISSWREL